MLFDAINMERSAVGICCPAQMIRAVVTYEPGSLSSHLAALWHLFYCSNLQEY